MTLAELLSVAATVAGLVMSFSPILQVRRMLRTRSSDDVSFAYLGLLCGGFVTWLAYGVAIANRAIVIANTASLAVMLLTIAVAVVLRREGRDRSADR